mgnify:CR=1 FL=1
MNVIGEVEGKRCILIDDIVDYLPATIELTLVSLLAALLVSIPRGVLAAVRKNTVFDRLATLASLMGISLPGFWFGLLLILFFGVTLQVLPVSGRSELAIDIVPVTHFLLIDTLLAGNLAAFRAALAHLVMPSLTLGLPMAAVLMRVTRTSMLEVLRQDYVTVAEAKGLHPRRVLYRHALKNALIPTVTVAALEVGSLLGGSMIVETVFGWPGVGSYAIDALTARDSAPAQGFVLAMGILFVLLHLVVDGP